jgi:predicted metal-binding protein
VRELRRYLKRAKELGAKEAKVIPADRVYTAGWVRLKCHYGCGGWGDRLTCPPNSPTPEETAKVLKEYRRALLVHGGDHADIQKIIATLEREIFLDGFHMAFALGAGPCVLCAKCGRSCRRPELARPAMEACGIDVYKTARSNGFPIEVVRTYNCKANYYGLVLVD